MGLTVSPTTGEAAEDSVKPIFAGDKIVGTLKVPISATRRPKS